MNPEQRRILTSIGVTLRDFPESIELAYTAPKLTMTLTQYAAGFSNPINMQDTRACFEAWCLIIKAKTEEQKKEPKLEIVLDVKDIKEADYDGKLPKNGHWGRFLYRILKFSEQYKYWFELSSTLGKIKDKFQNYLDSHTFVTSAPDKKPKEDIANSNLESYVEYLFCDSISAQKDILNLHSVTTIDRQLPVSLFEGSKSSTTGVFTGGKSAIDFWALNGDTINVYELKSDNPMVGIITEIFFYSNYVHDVFISKSLDHGKGSVEIEDGTYRSYDKIKGNKGKQVKGIMLSNSNRKGWHSSLDKPTRNKVKEIMNENDMSEAIQYEFLGYQLNPLKIGGYYISK
ncbi:hypothetical protein [Phascolarctobacterium succinatutens]|uniref:hypothetical protein n=1 Tax=Phascolarctobacterium succinatutens TaxID=626940 RepID=UPI0026EDC7B8|nr:hypothetical protein [Phascolarctobacterium succinatutens]MBS5425508.1 hypothetical protein [Phascolarctobacterium succinatutens]